MFCLGNKYSVSQKKKIELGIWMETTFENCSYTVKSYLIQKNLQLFLYNSVNISFYLVQLL